MIGQITMISMTIAMTVKSVFTIKMPISHLLKAILHVEYLTKKSQNQFEHVLLIVVNRLIYAFI